jgi:hypothetical protein
VPAQTWVNIANSPVSGAGQGAGSAYASSSAATDVSPAPQFFTQTWGAMYTGQKWRTTGWVIASNTGTPTLNLGVYYGGVAGVALCTSGTITTTTSMSGWQWLIFVESEVITIGSTGTIRSYGWVDVPTSATAVTRQSMSATSQDVTVNTTTNSAWTFGATWGTNNASNTLTCKGFKIEQG